MLLMAFNEVRHPEDAAKRPSRRTHGDDPAGLPTTPTVRESMTSRAASLLLVAPALTVVLALFVYPLGYSLVSAFTNRDGAPSLDNFIKTFALYTTDIVFTLVITVISTALVGLLAAGIGGYLVLGTHPAAVAILKWLYRWPLFIPFIVAAQCMRTFLAKNGMLNNTLDALGLVDVTNLSGLLDWRGIVITFVWKETPFVALLVSGAMAALDRSGTEAARNLGAGGLRILIEILLPQVAGVMTVGLVLAFVTMLSVLSVPIMISGGSPTMITVDMAFRVNSYSDYGTANALGFVSYLIAALGAWIYLRRNMASEAGR
jgi:putative spermidine/putrescine transport system permease protein